MTHPVFRGKKSLQWVSVVLLSAVLFGVFILISVRISFAESIVRWDVNGRITQPVVRDNKMYGVSQEGIIQVDLVSGEQATVISRRSLASAGELESISLFLTGDGTGILDVVNSMMYVWRDGKLSRTLQIQPAFPGRMDAAVACVMSGEVVWIATDGYLYAVDIATGSLQNQQLTGILRIGAHPEGGIRALQQEETGRVVLRVSAPGAVPDKIATLSAKSGKLFAVDGETGDVYADEDGVLSRLEGDRWVKLRPISEPPLYSGSAVWRQQFIILDQGEMTMFLLNAPDMKSFTIRGGNGKIAHDYLFSLAYPHIGIQRIQASVTAEDVYRAILSGDSTTDLFCIRAGYGMKALFDKGFATSAALTPLLEDVQQMHPCIRDALIRGEELYGYPEYVYAVDSWWRNQECADVNVPPTLDALLDFFYTWPEQGNELHPVARSGIASAWSRLDFARYAIVQWVLTHDEASLQFSHPALEKLFGRLVLMPPPVTEEWAEEPINSVFVDSDTMYLPNQGEKYADLIVGPEVVTGLGVCYRMNMSVYVVNPNSTRLEEVVTYLQFLANHRDIYQKPLLYTDIEPSRDTMYIEMVEELSRQEADAQAAFASATPEEKRDREEELIRIQQSKDAYLQSGNRWDYDPEDLELFQSHYVPRLRFYDSPFLSTERGLFPGLWQHMESLLTMCLDGQIEPAHCLTRMDELWHTYQKENQ